MAFVIFADGDMEGVEPENGTTFNYKELQKLVGGPFQVYPRPQTQTVYTYVMKKGC